MRRVVCYSLVLVCLSIVALFLLKKPISPIENTHRPSRIYLAGTPVQANNSMLEYFTMSTFGIGMIGMTFGFINLGSKRIKKHNDFLEEMVKNRTLVLEQKHQELIHQNEHYKIALNMIREQKDEIEVAQKELLAKNIEVTEALEEISAQNELIDVERTKLHQAQKIIKTQNAKLLSIARNLDQQVQERTRELSISNNLLLEKNKELDDFIYKSAHDLRGPIARFKGLSSLINLEYKLGNNITDHLEHLDDSASQMDSMLKRLSNVYEINARPVSIQQMKIDEVISGVLRQLQVEANYPVVNIKIDNECRRTVLCDPNLLQLIFRNLIGNAIRFADLGKAEKHVNVVVKQEEKQLKIIVKDNGLGIKEEHREKIFGLFFVGSEVTKGPGLGLYISRMISKKLNGSIELLSTDSTDETIFQVVIPI